MTLSQMRTRISALLGVTALIAGSAFAAPAQMTNMGPEDGSKQISITVWLNLHNKVSLDTLVDQMYDTSSPNYHHFLTMKQVQDQFAPTASEVGVVRDFLAAHNMKVMSTGPNNQFLVAQGSVANAQTAFNTQINRVMVKGRMHRVTATPASVTGPAAALVATVQGLSDLTYEAYARLAADPETNAPFAPVPLSAAGPDGLFFSANCLRPPETLTFTTNGGFPKATYTGNRYGADITSPAPNLPSCGYDAAEMQTAYGLNALYSRGLNGAGQTIVIVDAFGSNSIVQDANLFSQLNGLPALTPSNFQIVMPIGPATCTTTNGCISGNWQFETTLDVEWAHAIAPGANIVLVLAPDNFLSSLDLANFAAVQNQYGNVISNSFGIPEVVLQQGDPQELIVENGISQIAAALGISHNISTGDDGDNLALDQADFGIDSVSVNANPDSPYATGVGGTSTFLDSKNNIKLQTGWGLNEARIAEPTPNPPTIPPLFFGFLEGSGGGTSAVYAKPKFQRSLRGKFRLVPDISMNADPETGNEIIVSPDGIPAHVGVTVVGGTSLSTPMFSAVWAIANQAAGGGPIGQAAPVLYELPFGAITDVDVPLLATFNNVTGVIFNPPSFPTFESANYLAQPLDGTTKYISALFQSSSSTRWDVFTFGTDSSLATGPGWDNVTGLGTPNGTAFINSVVRAVR